MWEEVVYVCAGPHTVAQTSLKLRLLLPQAPEHRIYRHEADSANRSFPVLHPSKLSQYQTSNRSQWLDLLIFTKATQTP